MKPAELKKWLADARDRAIAAHPRNDFLSRDARLHRFIGALEILAPQMAELLLEVIEGKVKS